MDAKSIKKSLVVVVALIMLSAPAVSDNAPLVREEGRKITITNSFYTLSLFAGRGDYTWVDLPGVSETMKFYGISSIRDGSHRQHFPSSRTDRKIENCPDGKEAKIVFRDGFTAENYNVKYRLEYTFHRDRPVVRCEVEIVSDPVIPWYLSINYWGFGEEMSEKLMPRYLASPTGEGVLLEMRGKGISGRANGNKSQFCAIHDGNMAVGMIASNRDDTNIHVSENGTGYIRGIATKMEKEASITTHYIYLGAKNDLSAWAEKLYSE